MMARGARLVIVLGAAGSVALMLRSGYRSGKTVPILLLVLFTGWVLSPFVALGLADFRSNRLPARVRASLPAVMVMVALVSLAIYGVVVLGPPGPKPAAVFLMVPLGSWLLLAVVLALTARTSGRRAGPGTQP